jgi:hypothetical protein
VARLSSANTPRGAAAIPLAGIFGLACLVIADAGCSSAPPPGGFPKDPMMTVMSQSAAYRVEVRTSPQPPTRGDQSIEFTITDGATGAPATKLTVNVVPWMPVMLHGASIQPSVTETKPGVYLVTDVDMFMAGEWQLRTTIEAPAAPASPSASPSNGQTQGTGASTDHVGPIFQIP